MLPFFHDLFFSGIDEKHLSERTFQFLHHCLFASLYPPASLTLKFHIRWQLALPTKVFFAVWGVVLSKYFCLSTAVLTLCTHIWFLGSGLADCVFPRPLFLSFTLFLSSFTANSTTDLCCYDRYELSFHLDLYNKNNSMVIIKRP